MKNATGPGGERRLHEPAPTDRRHQAAPASVVGPNQGGRQDALEPQVCSIVDRRPARPGQSRRRARSRRTWGGWPAPGRRPGARSAGGRRRPAAHDLGGSTAGRLHRGSEGRRLHRPSRREVISALAPRKPNEPRPCRSKPEFHLRPNSKPPVPSERGPRFGRGAHDGLWVGSGPVEQRPWRPGRHPGSEGRKNAPRVRPAGPSREEELLGRRNARPAETCRALVGPRTSSTEPFGNSFPPGLAGK